jgi:hypothetical protein
MVNNSNILEFDEQYWGKVIQRPDWYLEFVPYTQKVHKNLGENSQEARKFRKTIRHFFEKELEADNVALAQSGPDLDALREPVNTIVIHHSGHPNYSLSYMNAVQLLNIYAPYYMNPTVRDERHLKGEAIWPGHFREGKPSFISYHWLMRMDGTFERLLKDEELGWHAGNWEINKQSVGICLDNDYARQDPTAKTLQKLATHIQKNYPEIKPENIIGHCEAREGTICPGTNFLDVWKPKLLAYIDDLS